MDLDDDEDEGDSPKKKKRKVTQTSRNVKPTLMSRFAGADVSNIVKVRGVLNKIDVVLSYIHTHKKKKTEKKQKHKKTYLPDIHYLYIY